jgi:hypothetical protein
LKLVKDIKAYMDKSEEEFILKVVGECSHQFEKDNRPCGVTVICLLSDSESH